MRGSESTKTTSLILKSGFKSRRMATASSVIGMTIRNPVARCQRTLKTSHFEGRIVLSAADAALGRDERTQRELTTFDFDLGGAWLVPPADWILTRQAVL